MLSVLERLVFVFTLGRYEKVKEEEVLSSVGLARVVSTWGASPGGLALRVLPGLVECFLPVVFARLLAKASKDLGSGGDAQTLGSAEYFWVPSRHCRGSPAWL